MESEQNDERAGEQQPDPIGAETAPVTPEPVSPESPVGEPEPVPLTDPEDAPAEGPSSSSSSDDEADTPPQSTETDDSSEPEAGASGILAGTSTEVQPGVGGTGDHPAPAAMVNPEDGSLHVAGEPPGVAASIAGADTADLQAGGDVTDPEARERLNAVQEPEQIETERPDIGTE